MTIVTTSTVYSAEPLTMTKDVITVDLKDSRDVCAEKMYNNHLHHLVVVDEKGNMAGLVSEWDILAEVRKAR